MGTRSLVLRIYLPCGCSSGRDQKSLDPEIHLLLLIPGIGWTGSRMDAPAMRDMLQHIDQMLPLPTSWRSGPTVGPRAPIYFVVMRRILTSK